MARACEGRKSCPYHTLKERRWMKKLSVLSAPLNTHCPVKLEPLTLKYVPHRTILLPSFLIDATPKRALRQLNGIYFQEIEGVTNKFRTCADNSDSPNWNKNMTAITQP